MTGLMGSIQLDCEINDDRTTMSPKFIEEYTKNWKEHTVAEFWQDSKELSKRKQKSQNNFEQWNDSVLEHTEQVPILERVIQMMKSVYGQTRNMILTLKLINI